MMELSEQIDWLIASVDRFLKQNEGTIREWQRELKQLHESPPWLYRDEPPTEEERAAHHEETKAYKQEWFPVLDDLDKRLNQSCQVAMTIEDNLKHALIWDGQESLSDCVSRIRPRPDEWPDLRIRLLDLKKAYPRP